MQPERHGPTPAEIEAAMAAHDARVRADERARVAAEIQAYAESIGWYESSGTWAEAIELAAGTHHATALTREDTQP